MLLAADEIRELIENERMIEDYKDLDIQLQPNGFDLRIAKIEIIKYDLETPELSFVYKKAPSYKDVTGNGKVLRVGYYLLTMAERVNLPLNIAALPMNRTSLFRFGSFIAGGWYDVGYRGTPQTGLQVTYPIILEPDSRVMQLGFLRVDNKGGHRYNGTYQEGDRHAS